MTEAAHRFTRGDHLQVWRPVWLLGYYHHGIYVSDQRVIQFGGGLRDKPRATVGAVTLDEFERGGVAEVVPHGGHTWWGAPRFDEIARERTVRLAERLVVTHPEGLYDLFGYNCEQAANFCSTGSYESYQVRGYFAIRSAFGGPVLLYIAKRQRDKRPFSLLGLAAVMIWIGTGLVPNILYRLRGARFMREVGRPLLEWERNEG